MSVFRARTTAVMATASIALGLGLVASPVTAAPAPASASDTAAKRYVYDVKTGYTNDPVAAKQLKALQAKLPKNWRAKQSAAKARTGVHESPIQAAVTNYLAGKSCQPTDLDAYVERLIQGIPMGRLFILAILGAFDYPTYDALLFGSKTDPDYALTPGTTGKVRGTMAVARSFWDIKNGDIDVLGMSSKMVVDQARVVRILNVFFPGESQADIREIAEFLIALIKDTTQLRGGGNPIFTLNAFAFTADGEGGILEGVTDRIVMGEGIIKALRDTGNIEVGPQMVFSHEFGHHIQFENGAYNGPTTPANTRKMELMADAYGTYLDAHARGLNFGATRINKAVAVAHLIGDCAVDDPNHHGTPDQRARAAAWGAALAKKNGNAILPSKQVEKLFLAALPGILKG